MLDTSQIPISLLQAERGKEAFFKNVESGMDKGVFQFLLLTELLGCESSWLLKSGAPLLLGS